MFYMKLKIFTTLVYSLILILLVNSVIAQLTVQPKSETYRPQVHFSPDAHWINDPNGMVYDNGVYHLFLQYHPYSSVWGPMHWAHATSKDLVHWEEQPIAIFPDSLGCIFSGSAVLDKKNTSGFGKNGEAPLVAIFTAHNMEGEKSGKNNFQNQAIAFSNDHGKTWTKFSGNPVIKNPGIRDFRDPKVMWYEPQKKWVMTLATKDRVTFYSSPDLKNWVKESEFGETQGAHAGVWECPDLFTLNDKGKKVWVLIVNINPGGPNGGSATQYFLGSFNGKTFTASHKDIKWLDYGPDEYAGITWSNTGDRKIFLGWMSNWQYALNVPTTVWRGATTLPRELTLKHTGDKILIASMPVKELAVLHSKSQIVKNVLVSKTMDLSGKVGSIQFPCRINMTIEKISDFSLTVQNEKGEELVIGFDKKQNQYFIDRTRSGKVDFEKGFGAKHIAPRFSNNTNIDISLVIDESSVELFADDGLTTMTEIFFPVSPYNKINLQSTGILKIKKLEFINLNSIWK